MYSFKCPEKKSVIELKPGTVGDFFKPCTGADFFQAMYRCKCLQDVCNCMCLGPRPILQDYLEG